MPRGSCRGGLLGAVGADPRHAPIVVAEEHVGGLDGLVERDAELTVEDVEGVRVVAVDVDNEKGARLAAEQQDALVEAGEA